MIPYFDPIISPAQDCDELLGLLDRNCQKDFSLPVFVLQSLCTLHVCLMHKDDTRKLPGVAITGFVQYHRFYFGPWAAPVHSSRRSFCLRRLLPSLGGSTDYTEYWSEPPFPGFCWARNKPFLLGHTMLPAIKQQGLPSYVRRRAPNLGLSPCPLFIKWEI